ncbi:MAG TPA: AAC(3) family N-acetyltransferase [Clostridiaceae bacterium]
MYTKIDLINSFKELEIKRDDTLLVHSSMKSIGNVENGADTVLDAFIEYLEPGLLIFPTHSWATINENNNVFNVLKEPACIGILPNLFMKREGVVRSYHPTHSVAALGMGAKEYTSGEEKLETPCNRKGCWGKLYDRKAKILFLGCTLKPNTYLHGVEEWNGINNRLSIAPTKYKIVKENGDIIDCLQFGHKSTFGDISQNYIKMEKPFVYKGIAKKGTIGDATSYLCDAVGMADLTSSFLKLNNDMFTNNDVVPEKWYK